MLAVALLIPPVLSLPLTVALLIPQVPCLSLPVALLAFASARPPLGARRLTFGAGRILAGRVAVPARWGDVSIWHSASVLAGH